jgi:hypothetical protein
VSIIKTAPTVIRFINRTLLSNDRTVALSGKRTATYVDCLISCHLQNRSLTKTEFESALAADEPGARLDRTGIKRLVEAADKALRDITNAETQRITHPARCLTTGPWQLLSKPHEQWVKQNDLMENPAADTNPALTQCGDALLASKLAHDLAVIDALIHIGNYREAAQLLAIQLQRPALSDECSCLFGLRLVIALRNGAQLENIPSYLAGIELKAARLPVRLRTYFLGEVAMFRARELFNHSPVNASSKINFLQLRGHLDASPNTSTQWEWFNLKALTLRRHIEKQLQLYGPSPIIESLATQVLHEFSSAYFWTLISKNPYLNQAVACNYAYNLYWLHSKNLYPNLDACIAWFKLAHTIVDKFDLPQDSAWDFLMLGDIYLSSHLARQLIKTDVLSWPEQTNPGHETFYQRALELARKYGDTRQEITALNQLAGFLQLQGSGHQRQAVQKQRDALMTLHKSVAAEMLKDGFIFM